MNKLIKFSLTAIATIGALGVAKKNVLAETTTLEQTFNGTSTKLDSRISITGSDGNNILISNANRNVTFSDGTSYGTSNGTAYTAGSKNSNHVFINIDANAGDNIKIYVTANESSDKKIIYLGSEYTLSKRDSPNANIFETSVTETKKIEVESTWRINLYKIIITNSSNNDNEDTVIKHTVNFNTLGGSEVQSQQVNDQGTVTLPQNPTRDGYKFVGWYTSEDLTEEFNKDTKITSDITLYAKWVEVITTTVTFDNEGTTSTINAIDGVIESWPANPKKDGYSFVGWFYNEIEYTEKSNFNENITLTAKFEEINYDSLSKKLSQSDIADMANRKISQEEKIEGTIYSLLASNEIRSESNECYFNGIKASKYIKTGGNLDVGINSIKIEINNPGYLKVYAKNGGSSGEKEISLKDENSNKFILGNVNVDSIDLVTIEIKEKNTYYLGSSKGNVFIYDIEFIETEVKNNYQFDNDDEPNKIRFISTLTIGNIDNVDEIRLTLKRESDGKKLIVGNKKMYLQVNNNENVLFAKKENTYYAVFEVQNMTELLKTTTFESYIEVVFNDGTTTKSDIKVVTK